MTSVIPTSCATVVSDRVDSRFPSSTVSRTVRALLLLSLSCHGLAAHAGDEPDEGTLAAGDLAEVQVLGLADPIGLGQPVPGAGSPQSYIGEEVIRQIVPPTGDFGTVANMATSFVQSAPNGPGFDAAKGMTLRGFTDGQFNVTMDGIPFGDPDNFQHHSTSYFPLAQIDYMVVDRGPGNASELGYANAGGSINMFSAELPAHAGASVYADYGSFDTAQVGTTAHSAAPTSSGEAGGMVNFEYNRSDGAMANSDGRKYDVFAKGVLLLGPVKVTGLYAYDDYDFYNPGSITTAALARYGSSSGYVTDPSSPDYYGWSYTQRTSDFGYVKAESALPAGWKIEDRLYTYSYDNTGLSLKGDQTSSPLGNGFTGFAPTDIAGRTTTENYRTYGNDLRVSGQGDWGSLLVGVWLEQSHQDEYRLGEDLTTGQLYDVNKAMQSPVYFDFTAHMRTVQSYLDYSYSITDAWNVRAGVRWQQVTRDFGASVIQNYLPGTNGDVSRTVPATLPSFETTYKLDKDTTAYAQVSKGSLMPGQSFFYTANPALGNQVSPETSVAEQIGINRQTGRYAVGVDVYNVDFDNYFSTITQNGNTLYVNSGSVWYRGIETEGHVALGEGFTFVANASLIRATFRDSDMTSSIQQAGDTISYAPHHVALAGFLFSSGPWSASLLAKFVGSEYQGKNGSADGSAYRVGAYSYTNVTLSYTLRNLTALSRLRATLSFDNVWNSSAITDNAGPAAVASQGNLINVLASRSVMLTVVADF